MHESISLTTPKIAIFLFASVLILLLFILAPILQPFYIAALIAYLSNPFVMYLEKLKIPRLVAVILVFLFLISILTLLGLFLVPLVVEQFNLLIRKLPSIFDWMQNILIPWIDAKFGHLIQMNMRSFYVAVIEGLKSHQDIIGKIVMTVTSSGLTIASILFQLILIPVVTFYLLRDWDKLIINFRKILPRRIEPTVVVLGKRYNDVLKAFLRGQLLVMVALGMIYTTGLWIVGLQFAVLIGVIAGLLSIVPYLGFTIGLASALIAAYYQFSSFTSLLYVLIAFLVGQSIESMLLTPLLVGDSIGLHPVAVIFAVLTGAHFFGLIGALLALPVAAAIMVLMRYVLNKYYRSSLYSSNSYKV